jgi:O-antigen/teichoic acid export membrane protein
MLRIANFVAAIVIARIGGAAVFGMYATSLAVATIATMLADNGLQLAAVREVSSRPSEINRISSRLYVSKALLFVPMVAILWVISRMTHIPGLYLGIAVLITVRTMLQSYCQVQVGILKAIDRMQSISRIQGAHAVALSLALAVSYVERAGVYVVLILLIAGQAVELILETASLWRNGLRPVRVFLRDCLKVASASTSIGITFGLANGILRMDVVLISLIAGATIAGVFAAAQAVLVIIYVVGWLLGSVLLPDMMRLADSQAQLDHFVRRWAKMIVFILAPGAVIAMVLAPPVVRTLFGQSFAASGKLLAVMIAAAPFVTLNSLFLHRAIAERRPKTYLGVYSASAAFSLGLNSALALLFGALGVAFGVVTREVLTCLCFVSFHRDKQAKQASAGLG